jgi:uncharacterized YigZ family protein
LNLGKITTSQFNIPACELRNQHVVVNSRFIATICPASSVDEARIFVARVRKEFSDANHNVPSYIIGGGNSVTEYCSDDGEPAGTAGKPALAVLKGSGLGNVALVITRYFGGTLLGKGGLVKAYTESAQLVVNAVPRARKKTVNEVSLVLPYNLLERIRIIIARRGGKVKSENFTEHVKVVILVPIEEYPVFNNEISELSSGKILPEIISTMEILDPIEG